MKTLYQSIRYKDTDDLTVYDVLFGILESREEAEALENNGEWLEIDNDIFFWVHTYLGESIETIDSPDFEIVNKETLDLKSLCVWCLGDTALGSGKFINRISVDTEAEAVEWLKSGSRFDRVRGYGCEACYEDEEEMSPEDSRYWSQYDAFESEKGGMN